MLMSKGIYLLGSDGTIEDCIAVLSSIRTYNTLVPICLIPFDQSIEKIRRLQERYNFSIYDNAHVLSACDKLGSYIHGSATGHYRKIAAWHGKFQKFIYIDTDTIVLDSVDFVFDMLDEYAFVTAHSNVKNSIKWVWKPSIYESGLLDKNQIEYAANTGFIASHVGDLDVFRVLKNLSAIDSIKSFMNIDCKEQPLLNYLIVKSKKDRTSLLQHSKSKSNRDVKIELWAGDDQVTQFEGLQFYKNGKKILFIHWAGVKKPNLNDAEAPYCNVWRHFRCLHAIASAKSYPGSI